MDGVSEFTPYDFVILGILTLLVIRGAWIGLIRQLSVLLALYCGYFVASQYHKALFPFLEEVSNNPKVIFLTSYVLLFFGSYLIIMVVGKGLRFVMELSFVSWLDRLLGALIGGAKGLIIIVLLHIVLGTILAPENEMLRECASCDLVGSLAESSREIIADPEVREALKPKEPAISLDKVKEYLEPITPSQE